MGFLNNYFNTDTSEDYRNNYGQAKNVLNNQKNINQQYTGNAGYQNAINQGLQGAAVTAGQAGQQATQAARNAGMTKGRAANLGATQAANAYGNNFMNQQQMAAQQGMNAVSANQGLAGQYQGLANQALAEQQARRQQAANVMQTGLNALGAVGSFISPLLTLSDKRTKNIKDVLSDEKINSIKDQTTHISDLASKLNSYLFEYKPEAQEEYGVDDKEHVGVMAQEMEKNPITASNVIEDENGIKHIDTNQQTLTNLALIADLARRLADLEEDK